MSMERSLESGPLGPGMARKSKKDVKFNGTNSIKSFGSTKVPKKRTQNEAQKRAKNNPKSPNEPRNWPQKGSPDTYADGLPSPLRRDVRDGG
jgi:hypothetical protein